MIHAKLADAPYRVDIVAAGHLLVADEPEDAGGRAAGPAPFELVLSGLAACTLITLRMYAERKGWAGFTASGRFGHRVEDGRHLIERVLEVSGAPDAAAVQRLAEIAEKTPVTLALKGGFTISTKLTQTADART
jgi:putative redox protein